MRGALNRLPLPPGFGAVCLDYTTSEIPHVFGLASCTGKTGGSDGGDGIDKAAEMIALEAMGSWAAHKAAYLTWPCAAICGAGACLDYTISRGLVVVLLAGFQGLLPTEAVEHVRGIKKNARELRGKQLAPAKAKGKKKVTKDHGDE